VLPLTASFGLCLTDELTPLKQTIEQADAALYQAKHGGRNQLQLWAAAG
jgi:PleD family two-component response regulator